MTILLLRKPSKPLSVIMNTISKNAVIAPSSKIGDNVTIKDFAYIEDDVTICDNVEIYTGVVIHAGTRIASGCRLFHSAAIGGEPNDLKFGGEYTTTEIGENTVIREFA